MKDHRPCANVGQRKGVRCLCPITHSLYCIGEPYRIEGMIRGKPPGVHRGPPGMPDCVNPAHRAQDRAFNTKLPCARQIVGGIAPSLCCMGSSGRALRWKVGAQTMC
jgi:hypothetical protein